MRAARTASTVPAPRSRRSVGRGRCAPSLAQGLGLHQRLHGLLEEERIPLGPLDEERREPLEPGVSTEEGPKELLRALRRQRVEAELGVGGLAAPGVLILGAVVDQEAERRRPEALDQAVEQRLRLGVDPVEIFDHEEQGLDLSLAEPEPLDRVERALAALRRIEGLPGAVLRGDIEQGEERGEARLQRGVERDQLPPDLLANRRRVVAVLDVEVRAEEPDHGLERRRLAIRDRAGVPDAPALGAGGLHDLPDEPRLADARLPDEGHELAVAGGARGPARDATARARTPRPTRGVMWPRSARPGRSRPSSR